MPINNRNYRTPTITEHIGAPLDLCGQVHAARPATRAKADRLASRLNALYDHYDIKGVRARVIPAGAAWRVVTRSTMDHFDAVVVLDARGM